MNAAAVLSDGGVVFAGYTKGSWNDMASQGQEDFAAAKLNSGGTVIWRKQVRQGGRMMRIRQLEIPNCHQVLLSTPSGRVPYKSIMPRAYVGTFYKLNKILMVYF